MTIKDIARESGYAISTVSRVLNNHADVSPGTRERVLAVVRANKFRLNNNAKHLKQRRSTIIAIIVKGTMNMLFSVVVETMQEQIKRGGYTAAVYYLDEGEDEVDYAQQLCRERQPAGLAFLGGLPDHFVRGFQAIALPSVLVTITGDDLGFRNLSSVSVDDVAGAERAVGHLLGMGHQEIGVIGGDVVCSGPTRKRLTGCERVFARQGRTFDSERQFESSRYSYQSAYIAMCRLLERMPQLTAVFCMSDVMAIGAMRALSDSGKRVPQDISVVGYDGIPAALFSIPRLATVRQDAGQLARRSIEILWDGILRGESARHELVPFDLVEGESASPPK